MILWVLLAVMAMLAVGFIARPFFADLPRSTPLVAVLIVFVVAGSTGLYWYKGSPGVPSGPAQQPDVQQMVASLAERLERQPDDINGWKMLGRSYMTLGNASGAVDAYRRAVDLESAQNASTLVALGAALAEAAGRQLTPEAVAAFENALALEPNHPDGLFWGGIAAAATGRPELAADRWEALLATNPSPEVTAMLRERIAAWRGEQPPPVPTMTEPVAGSGNVVTANVSVSDAAAAALPADATVFIIARDPAQPSPPIAVARRRLSELPASVDLGDNESMIPGRMLSAFAEFELVARVSLSSSPAAQPGDWYGSAQVTPADQDVVDISIDRMVQ